MAVTKRARRARGAPPKNAARADYDQLMKQRMGNSEACRIVGISRSSGTRWRHGHTATSKRGVVTKYPPSSRQRPSVTSVHFLSETERITIADLLHAIRSVRTIARELGRSPSTVSRETHGTPTSPPATTGHGQPSAAPNPGEADPGPGRSLPVQSWQRSSGPTSSNAGAHARSATGSVRSFPTVPRCRSCLKPSTRRYMGAETSILRSTLPCPRVRTNRTPTPQEERTPHQTVPRYGDDPRPISRGHRETGTRALGRRPHHREGKLLSDRNPGGTHHTIHDPRAPSRQQRSREPPRSAGRVDERAPGTST